MPQLFAPGKYFRLNESRMLIATRWPVRWGGKERRAAV